MNANAGDGFSSGGESRRRLARLGVNFLGFQSLWFACVVGAGYGLPGLGPAAAALWAGLHLSLLSRTAGGGGGGSGEGSALGGVGDGQLLLRKPGNRNAAILPEIDPQEISFGALA